MSSSVAAVLPSALSACSAVMTAFCGISPTFAACSTSNAFCGRALAEVVCGKAVVAGGALVHLPARRHDPVQPVGKPLGQHRLPVGHLAAHLQPRAPQDPDDGLQLGLRVRLEGLRAEAGVCVSVLVV